ncbi:MAG: hypothetical protein JO036_18175 [Candidatus Eremiobacteraeota bacterium]|nr:hypothetical protein [Candidatus Eremiobacteraeota bacterium]
MIVIFAGPSLDRAARDRCAAEYLPPAAQGDVYKAALRRPNAIGIIDGLFEGVPSVWHKEILWAMSQGIHVVGAASMGALRAAELAPFGMVGIGRVFEQFRDGVLEDDDEVAVLHGDAASGYRPFTEAMVDLRAAVASAVAEGIVPAASADRFVAAAKRLHYRDRTKRAALERAREAGIPERDVAVLDPYLSAHRVSQKREDALALVTYMAAREPSFAEPFSPAFQFQNTIFWQEFTRVVGDVRGGGLPDVGQALTFEDVLDELRLHFGSASTFLQGALLRFLAIRECERSNLLVDEESLKESIERFRREHGLLSGAAFTRWRTSNDLTEVDQVLRFFKDQARVYTVDDRFALNAQHYVLDCLRGSGMYEAVVERAKEKRRFLETAPPPRTQHDVQERVERALDWYASLGGRNGARPESRHVRAGYEDKETFLVALCKEFEFVQAQAATLGSR